MDTILVPRWVLLLLALAGVLLLLGIVIVHVQVWRARRWRKVVRSRWGRWVEVPQGEPIPDGAAVYIGADGKAYRTRLR